jgi:hypothetical protein
LEEAEDGYPTPFACRERYARKGIPRKSKTGNGRMMEMEEDEDLWAWYDDEEGRWRFAQVWSGLIAVGE